MTTSGPVANDPASLRSDLDAQVAAQVPDFTSNLPGLLVEDITSVVVGAMAQMDQARVDAINSITPYGANAFVLAQQGVMLGILKGAATNTQVLVVFSGASVPGYVIPAGFVVGDGQHQYVIKSGGVIKSNGQSSPLLAVATQVGTWAVPVGSVNSIVTSLPSPYNAAITVINPLAGTPSASAEEVQDYRARIIQANQVTSTGVPAFLGALLKEIPGVVPRLVSILQTTFGWEILCGGGDPYAVAFAIYQAVLDLSTIVTSTTSSRNVTTSIMDGTNSYSIGYVNPPQQVTTVSAVWNTNLPNFTSGAQVNRLGASAIQNYINGVIVGKPLNLNSMQSAFAQAISSILSIDNLSALVLTVEVNGSVVTPDAGTGIIPGDPESYFYCASNGATVTQG